MEPRLKKTAGHTYYESSLDDFSVIYMSHKFPSKRLKFAKSWVKENKEELMKEWTKYNVDGIGVSEEAYLDKEIKRL